MLAWTVPQVQIPLSSVIHISVISAVSRKVHTRHTFFQFLRSSSQQCIAWTLKVSSMMPVQHVLQYVHQLMLIFIFSFIINFHFHFHLLSIFHPLFVNSILINNQIWSLCSEVRWDVGDWRIYSWYILLNVSLIENTIAMLQWSFFGTFDIRQRHCCCWVTVTQTDKKIKAGLMHKLLRSTPVEKSTTLQQAHMVCTNHFQLYAKVLMKSHGVHKSLSAVHQPNGSTYI